jgi:hypothetical protein
MNVRMGGAYARANCRLLRVGHVALGAELAGGAESDSARLYGWGGLGLSLGGWVE